MLSVWRSRPTSPAVNYPASDPYATGVGGTNLTLNGSNNWAAEDAWSYTGCIVRCWSTGGGLSWDFSQPYWQFGPGVAAYSNGYRQVPDVSLDADPNTGYWFVYSGAPQINGGTSFAAPAWAGFAAVYNQLAISHGLPRLGYANPLIYAVANSSWYPSSFHDIVSGQNGAYYTVRGTIPSRAGIPNVGNLFNAFISLVTPATPTNTPIPTITPTHAIPPTMTFSPTPTSTPTNTPTATPTNTPRRLRRLSRSVLQSHNDPHCQLQRRMAVTSRLTYLASLSASRLAAGVVQLYTSPTISEIRIVDGRLPRMVSQNSAT